MSALAFAVIAFMLGAYVMLDGYDLGIGAIAPLVGRNDGERAAAMEAIGPFWNGNEVWLIAAGGALFALFPRAYASAFSGFYLPFMVVLWLLMFRGIAMELRGHLASRLWHDFWDVAFSASSALLILVFGVAMGNLLRGLPLDGNGYFIGTFAYLLNPYALLVGVFAVLLLALHGATFLAMRGESAPSDRARGLAGRLWWIVLAAYVVVTAATFATRAGLPALNWVAALPIVSLASLAAVGRFVRRGRMDVAFGCSSLFIATLIAEAAGTMFPYLLSAYPAGHGGLSIFEAAPSPVALGSALAVTVAGIVAVLAYGTWVLPKMLRKIASR